MTDTKEKSINKNELKAIALILFVIVGFHFVIESKVLIFAFLSTMILFLVSLYIRQNKLKLSKTIYYILLAFYNISSIFLLIDYYRGSSTLSKFNQFIFKAFIKNDKIDIRYIVWILVVTLLLLIIEYKSKNSNEGKNGR